MTRNRWTLRQAALNFIKVVYSALKKCQPSFAQQRQYAERLGRRNWDGSSELAMTKDRIAKRLRDIADEKWRLLTLMAIAATDAERRRLDWGQVDLQKEESELMQRLSGLEDLK